jgi:hypothetical protein
MSVQTGMQQNGHSVAATTWVETPRCIFECCIKAFSGDVRLTCSSSTPAETLSRPYQRISFGSAYLGDPDCTSQMAALQIMLWANKLTTEEYSENHPQ